MRRVNWKQIYKSARRIGIKFFNKYIAQLIFIGLPALGIAIGLLIGILGMNYARSVTLNDYGRKISYITYTVQPNDTIWNIASDLAALNPEYNDIRQYVTAIKEVNRLYDGNIKAGDDIMIPYYTSKMSRTEIYDKYGIE